MHEMGKFFSRFKLDGKNNDVYSKFLLKLKNGHKLEDILFVSLNYECLLEQAMINVFKWEIDDIYGSKNNKFIISENFKTGKLIKPHGSSNFWLPEAHSNTSVIGKNKSGLSINKLNEIKISITPLAHFNWIEYEILNLDTIENLMNKSLKYPIMSFYAPNKQAQIGDDLITLLKQKVSEKIQKAESISIIGVSPNFNDSYIWKYIIESNSPVNYLVPNKKDFEDLENKRKFKKTIYIQKTFENGYEELIDNI